MIKLDILSDPICPWCYIGKTYLDRALQLNKNHNFLIEWHPYQLNPEMAPSGIDRREYLEAKFGGKDRAIQVYLKISEAAKEAGLILDFSLIKRTPNTQNAHRLIHWAGLQGVQEQAVSELFKAYFEQGLDIGNTSNLIMIASSIGLNENKTRELFGSDTDIKNILDRDKNSRMRGVTGVPTFIVANTHVLTGAQPIALWSKVITELLEQK
ncbi:MAG: DsbA family oxidoreductase [Proteobacteria bacterium]|nr:DsbA family oxidoreductase [Pseudomonadota bacterium]